jgi:hypothetical protein
MLSAASGQQVKDQTLTMKLSQLRTLIAATLGTPTPGGNQ